MNRFLVTRQAGAPGGVGHAVPEDMVAQLGHLVAYGQHFFGQRQCSVIARVVVEDQGVLFEIVGDLSPEGLASLIAHFCLAWNGLQPSGWSCETLAEA